MVKTYSVKKDGATKLAPNFTVVEFACHDGSDEVLIDSDLVAVLQKVRDHFGKPVLLNSAYRAASYNAKIGGVAGSQHTKGTAADVAINGVAPPEVAQFAEYLMPDKGGIGLYDDAKSGHFVHIDVRAARSRWHQVNGKETASDGFPGYEPPKWYSEAKEWAEANGISDGARPEEPATRAEVWVMLSQFDKMTGGK